MVVLLATPRLIISHQIRLSQLEVQEPFLTFMNISFFADNAMVQQRYPRNRRLRTQLHP